MLVQYHASHDVAQGTVYLFDMASCMQQHVMFSTMGWVGWVLPTHTPLNCRESHLLHMLPSVTQKSDLLEKYIDALVEARKKKGLPRETAADMVKNDVNMFGVMMVACGDADGMVSGAMHTTAATVRPAMQVLKTDKLVSSVFFMCLPDKVGNGVGACSTNSTNSTFIC